MIFRRSKVGDKTLSGTHRLLFDGDPGIDDALAILFALKSDNVKLEGITTVGGNISLDLTTQNALKNP